ncbi:MAG TPA: FAD-dependent oxidoreductase [Verrucomicrobiota bacterium]|nr:FAD-dependent oxidoreductase [Verrucomicrobiota bacterium]HNU50612.1 FAD-dependent oxidoreductase [Verrucomicrobiota bacterium]
MSPSHDVIVVGAGIVGAACAAECAGGGLKVLVLDQGPIGGGATGAGMGHIVVMDDSEAQLALTAFSRQLWLERRPRLGPDAESVICGTLWVAADAEEMAEVRRKHGVYAEHGIRSEVLTGAAVADAEPNLRAGMAGGLRVPDDGVVYPPCVARLLLEEAQRQGAQIRLGAAVRGLLAEGGVQLEDGSRLAAGCAVNAAGPWSPALTPGLPVRKRKGHLVVTDRAPGFVRHQIVELGYLKSAHSLSQDSVAFNIQPRQTGQVLIGSSRQFDVGSAGVDVPILGRMLGRAFEYMPGLARLRATRVWSGHRPATPDKLPLIGPSAEGSRIWLATGHEGLGITTSLGTGRLLADLLLGRTPAIPAGPYLPSRFQGEKP